MSTSTYASKNKVKKYIIYPSTCCNIGRRRVDCKAVLRSLSSYGSTKCFGYFSRVARGPVLPGLGGRKARPSASSWSFLTGEGHIVSGLVGTGYIHHVTVHACMHPKCIFISIIYHNVKDI